jgi:SAM-dependent methyltransferase
MQQYIYSQGDESARQSSQAKVMHEQSLNLLREAGLEEGKAMVDFGCGTAELAFEAAREVGPIGKVLGVDYNPTLIAMNRNEKDRQLLDNMNFRIGLAENYSDIFLYDLAFARFLMAHTQNPARMVMNMLNLTKNYGSLVLEDVDLSTMTASPFCLELEVLKNLMLALVRYSGGDATIGPNLAPLMRWSGLTRIKVFEHQPCGNIGNIKLVPLRTLECARPMLLKVGLATPAQLDRLKYGLREMAEDDSVTLYFPKIYQVIGRNSQCLKLGSARFI